MSQLQTAGRITSICPGPAGAGDPAERGSTTRPLTRATLLLCARLGEAGEAVRPLSLSEYHALAQWLDARGLNVATLLLAECRSVLREYPGAERVQRLLRRVAEIDALIEDWTQAGLWVCGERAPEFPERLRQRLKTACLPLLFGAGPITMVRGGGLCVIGSRDSQAESQEFARAVGARAGAEGLVVISSDMRGVDREVISAAQSAGGRVICVLAGGLKKAAASRRFRDALRDGRTALVTPFFPDTGFAVANAMRANRYQYALSDAAIVVESRQTGGIWSGAEENRKHRWVPAFVRAGADVSPGNSALLHLGLRPITLDEIRGCGSLAQLMIQRAAAAPAPAHAPPAVPSESASGAADLFAAFVAGLARLDPATRQSEQAVARHFGIVTEQARAWLDRLATQPLRDDEAAEPRESACGRAVPPESEFPPAPQRGGSAGGSDSAS